MDETAVSAMNNAGVNANRVAKEDVRGFITTLYFRLCCKATPGAALHGGFSNEPVCETFEQLKEALRGRDPSEEAQRHASATQELEKVKHDLTWLAKYTEDLAYVLRWMVERNRMHPEISWEEIHERLRRFQVVLERNNIRYDCMKMFMPGVKIASGLLPETERLSRLSMQALDGVKRFLEEEPHHTLAQQQRIIF